MWHADSHREEVGRCARMRNAVRLTVPPSTGDSAQSDVAEEEEEARQRFDLFLANKYEVRG